MVRKVEHVTIKGVSIPLCISCGNPVLAEQEVREGSKTPAAIICKGCQNYERDEARSTEQHVRLKLDYLDRLNLMGKVWEKDVYPQRADAIKRLCESIEKDLGVMDATTEAGMASDSISLTEALRSAIEAMLAKGPANPP